MKDRLCKDVCSKLVYDIASWKVIGTVATKSFEHGKNFNENYQVDIKTT